ncbi:unnamed protein product [Rotaria sordida]|uniref:Uncharacterized protein n=1 Tax=Rotaria sordida TaxID=392033 RepID=A0A813WM00_9BILA|nr:unnamed protein product [Rotaria sordida]CAF1109820.1 unnamed protein product [Rotaria sordida]CAF3535932.1 unnamed protein product [Rotaria sordida]
MLVVKRPVIFNDNRIYYNRNKFLKIYDKDDDSQNHRPNYDLRLIICRHADRIDVEFSDQWYDLVFGSSSSSRNYRHPLLPHRLPHRSDTSLYVYDPPITRIGEQKSFNKGKQLSRHSTSIDYCYSSPACRSVITASSILRGMNRSKIPIRLEPYLFEPMTWNIALQEFGILSPFISNNEWKKAGYNIDRHYQPLSNYINPYETEEDFWYRSQEFFQTIEQRHGNMVQKFGRGRRSHRVSNILIVGHAATPPIFSNIAFEQPFNAKVFGQQCSQIPYLYTIVLERNAATQIWNIRHI